MTTAIVRAAQSGRGVALTFPLVIFLAAFFLWPLFNIFSTAVSNPAVHDVFPTLAHEAQGWSNDEPPTPAMQRALITDVRAANDPQAFGNAVRVLNAENSGFRSLFRKTREAVMAGDVIPDLVEVDPRWADAVYWRVLVSNLSRYTDRFLLAAIDLHRDEAGHIVTDQSASWLHVNVLLRTLGISAIVVLGCAVIGLPYAVVMVTVGPLVRKLLLIMVLLPLWTSSLVRVTAWFIILQNNGLINDLLMTIGITSAPVQLLFTRLGVLVAMIHVMLPFMVLPIFGVLMGVPRNLLPAAMSLGASYPRAVWHVLVRQSLRGVATGALFVFMTSLGFYILPALLGGATDQLVSSLIASYALANANWAMASALGLLLLVSTMAIHIVYRRVSGAEEKRP